LKNGPGNANNSLSLCPSRRGGLAGNLDLGKVVMTPHFFFVLFLGVYLLQTAASLGTEFLQGRHWERNAQVPPEFREQVGPGDYRRAMAYARDRRHLTLIETAVSDGVLLIVILCGVLPWLQGTLDAGGPGPVVAGWLFFMFLALLEGVPGLAFDYYSTFVVEERHGFNRSTRKLWVTDQLKGAFLSVVLLSLLLISVLGTMEIFPSTWWLWSFVVVSVLQVVLVLLYPVLIAPWFNTFSPLEDSGLEEEIRRLMETGGVQLEGLYQMDAGRRSGHTNAYFTGLGRAKRVVLFDTLLQSHPREEVLAVLAHELGHFKKKHVMKHLVAVELLLLGGLYAASLLVDQPGLAAAFGLRPAPYAGLFLAGVLLQKSAFFLQPLPMALSRRFEGEADRFAARLRGPKAMAGALKRMAADNLSNLSPHPLYVWLHYSHPPLVERVRALEGGEGSP